MVERWKPSDETFICDAKPCESELFPKLRNSETPKLLTATSQQARRKGKSSFTEVLSGVRGVLHSSLQPPCLAPQPSLHIALPSTHCLLPPGETEPGQTLQFHSQRQTVARNAARVVWVEVARCQTVSLDHRPIHGFGSNTTQGAELAIELWFPETWCETTCCRLPWHACWRLPYWQCRTAGVSFTTTYAQAAS
jgi:hypothetical protein